MQSRSLPTGVSLEYDLTGPEGAAVLCFVHGVGSNLRQFKLQRSTFENSHRVLRLSLRGHGHGSARAGAPAACGLHT